MNGFDSDPLHKLFPLTELMSLILMERSFQNLSIDLARFTTGIVIFFSFHSWKWSFPILSLVFRMHDACQAFEWCVNYKLIEHVFI